MNLAMERAVELPWSIQTDESGRFNKILLVVMAITLFFAIAIPNLTVEKPDRKKAEEIPPRFAKLILEKKTPPPPPPPKIEKKKPKKKVVKKKIKKKVKKKVVKKKIKKPDPDRARKVAEKSGLLAFADDL
ncbi:MAG: energy transducer TonB, partial [Gammaproteobacteria bacterium]|nr:energy transducer TonB [Gammaproteobacteria bacterium]